MEPNWDGWWTRRAPTQQPPERRSRVSVKRATPRGWAEESQGRRSLGGHKRSASWSSAEHLREVAKLRQQLQKRSRHAAPATGLDPHSQPRVELSRLAPRLRRSVEGLNLELEEVFVSETPEEQLEILDVPDGHRAPAPVQRCSSGSQSESSPGPLDLLSPPQSPCALDPSLLSPPDSPSPPPSPCRMVHPGQCPLLPPVSVPVSEAPPPSSPPRPSHAFLRQPPEGCERVRVNEEAPTSSLDQPFLPPSCPDLDKVNFTPHGGSAFCPVSLLKPLLPSMDLLFRGLTVSPVTSPGPSSPTRHLGVQ